MERLVILLEVTIIWPELAVRIKLDKQLWVGGMKFWNEPHYILIEANESMPDGLDRLSQYLADNLWPDISSQDRATLLNVTNAARGTEDQGAFNPL